jgi:hypothetical protein
MRNSEEDASTQDSNIPDKTSHLLSEHSILKPDQSYMRSFAQEDRFAIKKRFGYPEILIHKMSYQKNLSNLINLREDFVMPID